MDEPKATPEEKDAANEAKSKAKAKAQDIQDSAASAKKVLEEKQGEADTAKINEEATKEVKKDEAEIVVKKEIKKAVAKQQAPTAEALEKPWGSPSEVWTANMPEHHFTKWAHPIKQYLTTQDKGPSDNMITYRRTRKWVS